MDRGIYWREGFLTKLFQRKESVMGNNAAAVFVELIPLEELKLVTPAHKSVYWRLEEEYGEECYLLLRTEPSVRMCNCQASRNEPDISRHHALCLMHEHEILVIKAGEEEVKVHEMYARKRENSLPSGEECAAKKNVFASQDCPGEGPVLLAKEEVPEQVSKDASWCMVILHPDGKAEVFSENEVQNVEVDLKEKIWIGENNQIYSFGEVVLSQDGKYECALEGSARCLRELLSLQEKLICAHLSLKVAEAFSSHR